MGGRGSARRRLANRGRPFRLQGKEHGDKRGSPFHGTHPRRLKGAAVSRRRRLAPCAENARALAACRGPSARGPRLASKLRRRRGRDASVRARDWSEGPSGHALGRRGRRWRAACSWRRRLHVQGKPGEFVAPRTHRLSAKTSDVRLSTGGGVSPPPPASSVARKSQCVGLGQHQHQQREEG